MSYPAGGIGLTDQPPTRTPSPTLPRMALPRLHLLDSAFEIPGLEESSCPIPPADSGLYMSTCSKPGLYFFSKVTGAHGHNTTNTNAGRWVPVQAWVASSLGDENELHAASALTWVDSSPTRVLTCVDCSPTRVDTSSSKRVWSFRATSTLSKPVPKSKGIGVKTPI